MKRVKAKSTKPTGRRYDSVDAMVRAEMSPAAQKAYFELRALHKPRVMYAQGGLHKRVMMLVNREGHPDFSPFTPVLVIPADEADVLQLQTDIAIALAKLPNQHVGGVKAVMRVLGFKGRRK